MDISRAIEKDPEIPRARATINTIIDQLQAFGGQVTHLAKQRGIKGRLGGRGSLPRIGRHLGTKPEWTHVLGAVFQL